MKRMKGRLLAALMSLAMAFTMIPMMGAPVYADDPAPAAPGIALGPDVLSIGSNRSGAATVHMAGTKWRVIGYKGGGVASTMKYPEKPGSADTMTLIAADNLKTGVQFNPRWNYNNEYKGSNLHNEILKLTDENEGIFSAEEKAGILARELDGIVGGEIKDALLWPLSGAEAKGMDEGLRKIDSTWWLRSNGVGTQYTSVVKGDGSVLDVGYSSTDNCGLRPAFNFNLESVIFTSAAVGGKSSGTVGADSLIPVGTNTNDEWKVTVKSGHDGFAVEAVTTDCKKESIEIEYSKATTGKKEYISAVITDADGKVTYYGNLKSCASARDASGTVTVNVDGKLGTGDTLYVFNEQCNGDKKSDYASELKEVEIPSSPNHDWGAWTKVDDAQHQRVCDNNPDHVEKEGHTWNDGVVTKEATATATGVKTYTCTVCEATKTETIPKLTPQSPKVSGTLVGKTTTKGKTALTIGWAKIKGADGYDIFFAECNHGGKEGVCKKVKTIKGNKTFTWTKSGLKKGTAYKVYVKAYVMKNGKKTYVKTSPMMHAYTGNGTKNYTSAKSVTVNKTKVTLKKGKTFKIKAKVNKVNKKKKLMPKSHAPTLRYMTSDSKVATVNSSGKITAEGKGTCVIYVYAHNGVSKSIKVTVN